MRNRDNLHKKLKKEPDNVTIATTYKRYRNYCNYLIKKAKKTYEKEEINRAGGNKKQLWEVIKKITYTNKVPDHSACLVNLDNPEASINSVNTYFANVGRRLIV